MEKQRDKRRLTQAKTFGEFAAEWLEEARMADTTRSMRKSILVRDLKPAFEKRLLRRRTHAGDQHGQGRQGAIRFRDGYHTPRGQRHSMGGGGTLIAAKDDPTLKAAVPLAPWNITKNFSRVDVPTLIVACEKDTVATPKEHADKFYASLPADLPRGEVEIKGVDHMCSTKLTPGYTDEVGKATVAWLKRFLDKDERYDPLLKGDMNVGDFSRYEVKGF